MSSLDATSKKRLVLAIGLIALAITIGILFHSPAQVNINEVVEGLAGKNEQMECSVCGERFTMPADAYMRQMTDRSDLSKGLKCQKCGAMAAYGVGIANPDFDPESVAGLDLSTRASVQTALETATQELQNVRDDLARIEGSSDTAKIEELSKKVRRLDAKVDYLGNMWDKRAKEESAG